MEEKLLYEEGVFDRDKKKARANGRFKIYNLIAQEISLVNFEEEEERDGEAVKLYVNKYRKLFKYLFNKYANTGYKKTINTFDAYKDKLSFINISEITRMLKEHGVISLINREEVYIIYIYIYII